MTTWVGMCESDKVFCSIPNVNVNLCGWNVYENLLWSPNFLCYYCLFGSLFMCSRVCVYTFKLMRTAVIEAVLQHTVWCLQPESCHKQSAPASVKQLAWENWVLCRLQPTPRSLNRPTHLPNAPISKWAMDIPSDIAIVMRQLVGQDSSDTGQWVWEVLCFDTE